MNAPSIPLDATAEELARLAAERPELWPAIHAHPNAYPALREWIAAQAPVTAAPPQPETPAPQVAPAQAAAASPWSVKRILLTAGAAAILLAASVFGIGYLIDRNAEQRAVEAAAEEAAAQELEEQCAFAESLVAPLEEAYDREDDDLVIGRVAADLRPITEQVTTDTETLSPSILTLAGEAEGLALEAETINQQQSMSLYEMSNLAEAAGRMSVTVDAARSDIDQLCAG